MGSTSQANRSSKAKPATGRVLAIDYGTKRMGLAISDELGLTAQPLITLERTNRRDDLRRIRLLARENQVCRIVVGLPLHLDGRTSEMAVEVNRFATRLKKNLGLPVELADERLTSWEAKSSSTKRPVKKRVAQDDVAAAIILRDYLSARLRRKS